MKSGLGGALGPAAAAAAAAAADAGLQVSLGPVERALD